MTDKEFKRLRRAQLIEIIYQLQLKVDELGESNLSLQKELEDKRLRISQAGNIAVAALEINDCFKNAQNAAEQYLCEIKLMHKEAQEERDRILAAARAEAEAITSAAKKTHSDDDSAK